MIEKGNILSVECTGMGHNGEGVCRYDGLALFVPSALPGEIVEIEVTEVKKRFAAGKVSKIIKKSEERIDPICPLFGECGGCQLQHLDYNSQLRWKKRMVEDAFSRIGNLKEVTVNSVLGMDEPLNYRNKMQLPVGLVANDVAIGCYQRGSHQVVDATVDCFIQSDWNNQLLQTIRKLMKDFYIPCYQEGNHSGWLRHIMGRSNRAGQGILVLVGTTNEVPENFSHWLPILQNIEGLGGIVLNLNSGRTNTVLGRENILLFGQDQLLETLGNLDFSLSATAFFQVNPVQTEVLYSKVREFAELTGEETILDAYCGTGTIGLYLARDAKKIIGVERYDQAVEDAKKNAEMNQISNCEFWAGDVEKYLDEIQKLKLDLIIVDPPRSGCSPEMLEALNQTGAKRMIYVSCNPSTLARDAKWLDAEGWKIKKVQPVDMFPHTAHVECVVLMSRVQK